MNQIDTSIRNIFHVTGPLVIAGIAMNMVGIVDMMLVSDLGEAQLGGTGNGQILYAFLFVIGMGFTSAIQIFIGRRNGEKKYNEVGSLFFQGLYFAMAFAIFLLLFIHFVVPQGLSALFDSEAVVNFTNVYIQTRGWGVIFTLANLLFIGFFVGITQTKILGFFTPLISVINITLDIFLINGYGPFPMMGVQGAAVASVISEGLGTLIFTFYMLKYVDLKKFNLNRFVSFSWEETKRILKVANPIMIQNAISIGAWGAFFVFVENLGERALAVSQIIRGIYIFVMVPVFSLADATNTFVSNLMGEKSFDKIIPLIRKTSWLGFLLNVMFFAVINLFPDVTLGFFTSDVEVIEASYSTLRLTTVSMFFFTAAFMPFRAISGTGNTRTALFIESISVGIYLIYTYYVAVVLETELYIVWSSEFIYFGVLLALSWLYLIKGNWQQRII